MDSHARTACDKVKKADANRSGLIDGVVLELGAIAEAGKSSNKNLAAAANATTAASDVPSDNPIYVNPGDYQFAKVAEWCGEHT
jgi:hypothetical protein